MIRKFGFVVLMSALIISACGRQVTPNPPDTSGAGQPGTMTVKFRVDQALNFQNYSYVIVFNTSGDGSTPRANGTQTNYRGYSFAIVVSGNGTTASANLYQYYRPPGFTAPQLILLQTTPQQLILVPNSNSIGTEFTVNFARSLFFGINSSPQPTTSASTSPSPSPTASVSPSPTASGSSNPSGSPSTSPSPSTCSTTPPPAGTPAQCWNFNFFVASGSVAQQNLVPLDSLGGNPSGATDTTYTSQSLDTTQPFDYSIVPLAGNHPADLGADTIAGGEIANNP